MRAKRLSFILIFVLLSSNAYASFSRFCSRNLHSPFFDTNSFNSFHLKIAEDYPCFKFILICLFYPLEVLLQVRFPYWEYLEALSIFVTDRRNSSNL